MKAIILWIEGKKATNALFLNALQKEGHHTDVVSSLKQAIMYSQLHHPDIAIAHLPSLRISSHEALAYLASHLNGNPMVILCPPEKKKVFSQNGFHVIATPCTPKKLTSAIKSLLPSRLQYGNLTLDLDNNLLFCEGREIALTPRMTRILYVLIRRAGEVIEKKELFSLVWNTTYNGDTRSLDVHINWLRKAIEPDPKNPRYIITLRGLGYRLDA